MKLTNLLLCSSLLISPIVQADEIPAGQQLQQKAEQKTRMIDTQALRSLLKSAQKVVLIDIRTADEIRNMGGSIKSPQNAHIPRGWLEYRVQRLASNKDTPIVVYCGAGLRSPFAAETLQNMGYRNVKNYSEGYLGWKKAGLPIGP